MKALTIKQPWAWAIAHGQKNVENRTWATSYRGLLAIHAGAAWDGGGAWDRRVIRTVIEHGQPDGFFDPPLRVESYQSGGLPYCLRRDPRRFVVGAVVAVAELVGITRDDDSPWAQPGQSHWRLASVRALAEPVPCKGLLGLWTLPEDVDAAVRVTDFRDRP